MEKIVGITHDPLPYNGAWGFASLRLCFQPMHNDQAIDGTQATDGQASSLLQLGYGENALDPAVWDPCLSQ